MADDNNKVNDDDKGTGVDDLNLPDQTDEMFEDNFDQEQFQTIKHKLSNLEDNFDELHAELQQTPILLPSEAKKDTNACTQLIPTCSNKEFYIFLDN